MPHTHSWSPDSIAGRHTVERQARPAHERNSKYPPLQFWINDLAYAAFGSAPPSADPAQHFGRLILISRVVSTAMATGALLAVFLAASLLYRSAWAGVFAAATLATAQVFVHYAHVGNVDMPLTSWFAWSLYAAVAAVELGRRRDFVLLGVFAAATLTTKEAAGAYLLGLGIAVCARLAWDAARRGADLREAVGAALGRNVLLAAAVCIVVFVLVNDLIRQPGLYITRLDHWLAGPMGLDYASRDFAGQFPLALESLAQWAAGVGWPLFIACGAGLVFAARSDPRRLLPSLLPPLAFYLLVIVNIEYTLTRFWLPALPALALAVGGLAASLWEREAAGRWLGRCAVLAVLAASTLYSAGLSLEFANDTRVRAEEWLAEHPPRDARVVALAPLKLAPRLDRTGRLRGYRFASPRTDASLLDLAPGRPDYLVVTSRALAKPQIEPAFAASLLAGELGYDVVARFENRFLLPRLTAFSIWGWPYPHYDVVSPTVTVLERRREAPLEAR